jgi:hypothetical protein
MLGPVSFTRFGMQIYVGKNGQQLGPFSLEEINRKLADGSFAGTDLGWYEGAPGWAPLSGVPGVILPAPTAAPAPAPSPVVQPAATPTPTPILPRPNAPIVQRPRSSYRTLTVVSWVLLGITFVVSFIPLIGCGAWFLVWPVAVAAIIMGIITVVRGGTAQGVFIILAAVLIVPLCFLGQFVSLALFGGTMERRDQTQIMENLRTIESAKTKWAGETKAAPGALVTMATLTTQFNGKEIKPVVGEQYDPMPVGQPPTATLPTTKTLGTFSGGDVLTAASIEKALASTSPFSLNLHKSSPSPTPMFSPSSSPKLPSTSPSISPTIAPIASPSARPSVSPRPTGTPHSLISPRQAPDDAPPSTRPSPSAKFAPRNGPRQTPPPSSNPPESGGLKQGRQYPRESPSETPEEKSDDDDEE